MSFRLLKLLVYTDITVLQGFNSPCVLLGNDNVHNQKSSGCFVVIMQTENFPVKIRFVTF